MEDGDRPSIDLNADAGEGGVDDAALFAAGITSVNIACGAHAGDAGTMRACCALAARHGVAAGAHPGHADREGFGRRELPLASGDLAGLIGGQLRELEAAAARAGVGVTHVKPHGALYHQLDRDAALAREFVRVCRGIFPAALIYGPPAGELRRAAEADGCGYVPEGFVDRAYRADGTLVPRDRPGAVLTDVEEAAAQALALARAGRVRTLCVHGDGEKAARMLNAARARLIGAGFRLKAPV